MTNLDGLCQGGPEGEKYPKTTRTCKATKKQKKEVWKSLVKASSSAQPMEEKKEEEDKLFGVSYSVYIVTYTRDVPVPGGHNFQVPMLSNLDVLHWPDGYVVKELLKVTSVLYNAIRANAESEIYHNCGDEGGCPSLSFDISSKPIFMIF